MLSEYDSPYSNDYQANIVFEGDYIEDDQEELDDVVYESDSASLFFDLPGKEEAEG